jgi:prepilin signal peptidase PulO-like enzyme (type II secretory pathway)
MATSADASTAARESSPARAVRSIAIPDGVVAAAAIAAAAGALTKFDLSGRAFVAALYCGVLVVLAAIDLEQRVIPNRIVVPAAAVVLLGDIAAEPGRTKEWTIAAFATMLGALVVVLGTRGGVGMGDVKLAFLLGAGLGWNVLGGVVVAMLATFVVAVGILVRRGLTARKDVIPFGPFLALGAIVALFLS